MKRALVMVAGVALLAVASFVGSAAPKRQDAQGFELQYFPSGKMIHVASLGFDGLAADYAFLSAVQYYGKHRQTDKEFPWAPHLFDVITQLDARFMTPYILGAWILAEDLDRMDMALGLLGRGAEALPNTWELPFQAGFMLFAQSRDRAQAAGFLDQARRHPEAPEYVHKFAAQAFADGGSADKALEIWREIARDADDPGLREVARRKIESLEG